MFECLATEIALMWFEGYVNANVRGDMVALHGSRTAVAPLTGEVQIVGTLSANMSLANVILFDC